MLERLQDLPAGLTGLRAKGKVTKEDYAEVVHPLLEEARREGKRLRFFYEFGPEFEGFTAGAAWADARVGIHYLRLFERCAIVTDMHWLRDAMQIMGGMMPCPVKVFPESERADAIAWLGAEAKSGLAHRLIQDKGVLVVEPSGPLAAEDFDALGAVVDPWIESHGKLQGLVLHVQAIPGWENLGGLLRHLRFVRDHHRNVRRVALVADGKMAELAPKIAEHFVDAELRHFAYPEFDDAIAWAGA